jgi:tRNA pseudouridine38-40 synthase
VCHFNLPAEVLAVTSLERLTYRLSRLLPEDIRVRRVTLAPGGFDARFSACWRRYVYRVSDDPFAVDPLTRHTVLWWPRRLDVPVMHRAAQPLLGEHDFAAFCKRRDGATTIRTLHELTWTREGDRVTARVVADAFCHHMVRALVGCLLTVGEGRQDEVWPGLVLEGRSRDPRVRVVSAHGLSLEEVGYPVDDAELAAQAAQARAVRTMA